MMQPHQELRSSEYNVPSSCRNLERNPSWLPDQLVIKEQLHKAEIPVVPEMARLTPNGDVTVFVRNLMSLNKFVLKSSLEGSMSGTTIIVGRHKDVFKSARGELVTQETLTQHIINIISGVYAFGRSETAFVEPRLKPAAFFASFYPVGITEIHLEINHGKIVNSLFMLPTLTSEGRSRLHMGAIGVTVDPDTGITAQASQAFGKIFQHPENGLPLIDRVVPDWTDIISIATAAAKLLLISRARIRVVVDQQRGPLVLDVKPREAVTL